MTSKLTRDRLQEISEDGFLKHGESKELARMALAAMDSEPVALQPELAKVIYHFRDWNEGFPVERFKADYVISWMLANYPPAQPAKDREQVRREHAEWSQATFGNVGPVGPLKHLSKEALEAAAEPGDLSEWADMQFLLWDAQRRAGITDDQVTQAMIDKLAVNKQREWPEPKDGEPRLHIKEQPAPVVPEEVTAEDCPALVKYDVTEADEAWARGFNSCRAAMLAAAPQSPGSELATVPGKWIPVSERMPEVGVKVLCFPVEDEPIHAAFNGQLWLQDISWSNSDEPIDNVITCNVTHWMPLPAAPQETNS